MAAVSRCRLMVAQQRVPHDGVHARTVDRANIGLAEYAAEALARPSPGPGSATPGCLLVGQAGGEGAIAIGIAATERMGSRSVSRSRSLYRRAITTLLSRSFELSE